VYLTIQGSEPAVFLEMYALSEVSVLGWDAVKYYKDRILFRTEVHLKVNNLRRVLNMVNECGYRYPALLDYHRKHKEPKAKATDNEE